MGDLCYFKGGILDEKFLDLQVIGPHMLSFVEGTLLNMLHSQKAFDIKISSKN